VQTKVTTQFQEAYDAQYRQEIGEWRMMNAKYKAQNIMDVVGSRRFKRVLDVGAGDGSILSILGKTNIANELYAVEISSSALEQLKTRNIDKLSEALQFDGYSIPYPDKHFDAVVLSHVLEHVEHERVLLREIKRVSHHLIIEVPRDYMLGVDKRVKHFLSYGHINMYTPTLLRFLLQTEGFEIQNEKLSILHPEILLYNVKLRKEKSSFLKNAKIFLSYQVRKAFLSSPVKSIRERYCNAVTILTKSKEDAKIM
jgi:ubiquinone/menaquinone biosynthesis C-methylase UbiE